MPHRQVHSSLMLDFDSDIKLKISGHLLFQLRNYIFQTGLAKNWAKGLSALFCLFQLEVDDCLNHGSSREVHAYDSKALVQVRLVAHVVVQLCVDALSDGSGMRKQTSSTAEGQKHPGRVAHRCSHQVLIDALPFLLHMQKCVYLRGTAKNNHLDSFCISMNLLWCGICFGPAPFWCTWFSSLTLWPPYSLTEL